MSPGPRPDRNAVTVAAPGEPPLRPDEGAELPPGTRLGSYEVEELRGEGGFAALYRGHAVDGGRAVAIKVLLPHMALVPQALERLRREADAINALAHPNVVELLECGQLGDGRPYLVMEWLEGRNLEEQLATVGRFDAEETLALVEQIGSALAAVHEAALVHRDVKAQNIMAVPRGDRFVPKLVDFGIAKLLVPNPDQPALTASRQVVGTPLTMAPEQIRGEPVDRRTDVYALGLLVYQLLTGRLPFHGATAAETEELHLHASPPRATDVAHVAPAVDLVLARALAKQPAQRYDSVGAMLDDLRRALGATVEARVQRALAIGVLARPRSPSAGDGDAADAADAAVDRALARAREALATVGLNLALETQEAVVAWASLAATPGAGQAAAHRLIQAAASLHRELAAAEPAAGVGVVVHAGTVEIGLVEGRAVASGELLRVDAWLPIAAAGGFWVSDSARGPAPLEQLALVPAPEQPGWLRER